MISIPDKKQQDKVQVVFDQVMSGMGFIPNSLKMMSHKPNILGSFVTLFGNIRGFSDSTVSTLTAIKIFQKNVQWSLDAKKKSDEEVPLYLKNLIAHVSSNASGCRYCQAHTAWEAYQNGAGLEKIENVWQFETSPIFSEQEKVALRFALAAGSVPNLVTEEHHFALREHYSEAQIVEIVATISVFGFLNRWNDSMITPLEDTAIDFANKHLKKAGWEIGKHA